MALVKVRVRAADLGSGRAGEAALTELLQPEALAVTLFEAKPSGFFLEAYYAAPAPLAAIREALRATGARFGKPALAAVPEANWVAIPQAALPPVRAGRFIVHSSHDRARFGVARHAVEIEAGEAFGTGRNATTAGCLTALARLTLSRRFARVLDLGCGSGVLAIAAARALPHARILAVDHDPRAVEIARANVRLNRVAARVKVWNASGFAHPLLRRARCLDLVLANLLPGPLIALAPAMRRAMRTGGIAVLSGLLHEHAREVVAHYRAMGFDVLTPRRQEGWTVVCLTRSPRTRLAH
jgi:ribosomal protein L11 methyltransferase